MIYNKDKLEEAVNKMIPIGIDMEVQGLKNSGNLFCWIWLHKGIDSFMSEDQFRNFYWIPFKKMIEGLVKNGVIPMIYGEGSLNTRLEFFTEVPMGKCLFHFENADLKDMAKAKDLLRDVACISGNIPNLLFKTGSPEDIKDYTKKLIDICGKGGGYIMDTSALLDEGKVENVRAWFDFTREYGKY